MLKNIVWTIAGSDCTGGAGIQADIKTIHNLGSEACSVITAVTAQNIQGVHEINAVSDDVLISQLKALSEDKRPSAIKIGMLANKRQVLLVSDFLANAKQNWQVSPYVVYDPVAIASSGGELTEEDILPTIKQKLLPLIDLLTPNANEVQRVTGVYLIGWSSLKEAAIELIKMGVGAVVIKGGHIDIVDHACVDYCTDGANDYWLSSERIESEHSHGSGCTFASSMAALIGQGYLLRDAFILSKAYINQGIKGASQYEGIYGPIWQGQWPNNITDFPQVLTNDAPSAQQVDWQDDSKPSDVFESGFASVDTDKLGLYPVVDSVAWIERLLKAGVKTIQLRDKIHQGQELENEISQAVALGKHYQARVFINDYWQLAIKHGAYGVHLGQEDLEDADLQAIKQAGLRLGVSTHGHYEMVKIMQYKPSYLAVGAIFPTQTKDMTGQIQGVETLSQLCQLNQSIPMVAIGGITLERAQSVAATGVGCIAVVTALTQAENPEANVAAFEKVLACH
ncbi:phosphomethylpyrimidine kinase [Saccharobesus litoralis]|uniref:Thiamine-phosphate synthase n=1 Tax=Saccharobesus litoralis TaxID=2172099 RepID=A0A2S0VMD4_9ALTE|nr:thiamine phosphate synthase [Saccharobesus litoralis]AWB65342.1 phosphomethylpyrimidine kinase [Saccharobesus litoralis]